MGTLIFCFSSSVKARMTHKGPAWRMLPSGMFPGGILKKSARLITYAFTGKRRLMIHFTKSNRNCSASYFFFLTFFAAILYRFQDTSNAHIMKNLRLKLQRMSHGARHFHIGQYRTRMRLKKMKVVGGMLYSLHNKVPVIQDVHRH